MKVESVELRNFKKHEDLILDVNGRNIFLLGPNEVGKSSILDSIFFALNSAKETPESKIPEPLTTGKKAGHVKVVVGGDGKQYTITRKFVEGSDERKLTIVTKDGLSTTKLDMLEGLVGYRKVNPFEFVAWGTTADGRRKQLQLIESLLTPDVRKALSEIATDIALRDEQLKSANGQKLSLNQALTGLGVTEHDLLMYADPIDINVEATKLQEIQQHNLENARKVESMRLADEEISKNQKQILELQAEIKRLELINEGKKKLWEETGKWIDEHPVIDETPIRERITEAQAHNNRNTLVVKHAETCRKLEIAEQNHGAIKIQIDGLQAKRKETIAAAKLPIPGLTFDAEQVYLHGLPLHSNQLATSQIMRLAFAIALATVKDDKLKLLCIPRGESLDKNAIADLKQFLKENPTWQCFLEEVDRNESGLKVEYFETT